MSERRDVDPERVLVLAPTPADATLTQSILAEANLTCEVCPNLDALGDELDRGAGAILLTEEVLSGGDARRLLEAVRRQPPWSDIPILLLSSAGSNSTAAAWALELLGNVAVLERPVRLMMLVSALRTAIRARRRQYEIRNQLTELAQAESSLQKHVDRVRLLWEAASVLLTTDEPDAMMHTLFSRIAPHLRLDAYLNYAVADDGDALELESYAGLTDEQAEAAARVRFGEAICGAVAIQRQTIVAANVQDSDDPRVQLLRSFGIHAYASSPLIAEGRLLGTLSFASRRRNNFDDEELEFLWTICHYVTVVYERARLIRELRDTDRRKDEFLATLAHELRNPLAPTRNALQIMRLASDDPSALDRARTMMERQLGQMVRIIDDLLDVNRITQGKLELRKERVELSAVIKNAVDTALPLIEASGHELTLDAMAQPIHLEADPVRLAQVLSNLLNNAAKYMERGGRIWLTMESRESEVILTVRDNGIGIPTDALSTIFDMFTQVDRSLEKSQGGLGIGLTLVKRLVELHGGSVEAFSDGIGKGARFVVRLPIVSATPAPSPGGEDRLRGRLPPCRVLVADDNHDTAESMGTMLRLMGNEVRVVHDGVQAIEEAAAFQPDLILLDIGMPRMNGYAAARRIRAERWGQRATLVALTGWGQTEDKLRAMESGFDRHFTKPVSPVDLEHLIAGLHAPIVRTDVPAGL